VLLPPFEAGDRVRCERAEPARGSWARFAGREGAIVNAAEVGGRLEWCVRWRRANWRYRQMRTFQHRSAAERLVRKLQGHGRRDLAPLVEIVLESRPVGQWTVDVDTLGGAR